MKKFVISGRRERINDDIVEYKSRTDPFSQNMSKDMDFYDKELSLAIDLPHMTTSSAYRDIEGTIILGHYTFWY